VKRRIAVIGTDAKLAQDIEDIAELIGENIALNDCILICGGRGGVMQAACRGAKKAGGRTVGILPSLDGRDANRFVDVVITTGMGYARNSLVVSSADAVIAVSGSAGTLSEIGMALSYDKPVVVVDGSGGVSGAIRKAFPKDQKIRRIVRARPDNAVEKALSML
jgi:uncharacterized protein (TIGR00725 family)